MKFLSNLNLNKNEILNARIQNLDEASIISITSPVEGQIVFDTTNKELKIHNGTGWEVVGKEYEAGSGLVLDGYTFNHSNVVAGGIASGTNATVGYGGTILIPTITYDNNGHITAKGTTEVVLPALPTLGDLGHTESNDFGIFTIDRITNYNFSTLDGSVSADSLGDTLVLVPGEGINLGFDSINKAIEILHGDTSDVVDLGAVARTYITGMTFDSFGHVIGYTTGEETVIDTNDYVNGVLFNTSTGVLTLERTNGLVDLTVNLDGRYLQSYTEVDTLDSVTGRGAITTNSITVGGLTVEGDTVITGNLSVQGNATSLDTVSLQVEDYIIEIAKNNTVALPSYAGFVIPNYDGTNDGGIIIDANGEFRVGDISYVGNTITDISSQAVMTRDEIINFSDQDIVVWDSATSRAVGKTALEASIVKKYAAFIGDGAATAYTVTHNLGTSDVTVTVKDATTNELVFTDIIVSNTNSVNVSFATAPALDKYRVIVTG